MQTLKGVIIKCRPSFIEIELEGGTILKAKGNPKFKFGAKVLVLYDFTKMKVRDVLENEWFPGDEATPPVEEPIDEGVNDPKLLEYYAELAEENL